MVINMSRKKRKKIGTIFSYIILIGIGITMVYPLVWMFFASFKTNEEIYGSIKLLPSTFNWDAYRRGWEGIGGNTYATFFKNTFLMVVPTTILTLISSMLVAYGFARFNGFIFI